jgi:hypothetical protein
MTADGWTKLHVVENVFEMEALRSALENDGIECFIKEYKDTAYDGLFVLQKGYAAFFVKNQDLIAAQNVVNTLGSLPNALLPEN